MTHLLEALAAFLALPSLGAAGVAWVYIRRLRRPIMLSPSSGFKPPLRWRWSFSSAAIYHRRMVIALRTARATAESLALELPVETSRRIGPGRKREEVGWDSVLGELEAVAVGIDKRLVALEREPREVRRRMAAGFESDVSELEQAAAEAVAMFRYWHKTLPQGSALAVADRLAALRRALEEIRQLSESPEQSPPGPQSLPGQQRPHGPGGLPDQESPLGTEDRLGQLRDAESGGEDAGGLATRPPLGGR